MSGVVALIGSLVALLGAVTVALRQVQHLNWHRRQSARAAQSGQAPATAGVSVPQGVSGAPGSVQDTPGTLPPQAS